MKSKTRKNARMTNHPYFYHKGKKRNMHRTTTSTRKKKNSKTNSDVANNLYQKFTDFSKVLSIFTFLNSFHFL